MKIALWKDMLREIRLSMGRFLSILAIVAIGVAFFAGVKASVPDMKYTADRYFDEFNLQDIKVVSTGGLTDEDVAAIREIEGVEGVSPSYSMDVLTQVDTSELVLKVHSLPKEYITTDHADYINRSDLVEGRLPEKSGECLIEASELTASKLKIGDTFVVSSGTDTDISKSLKTDTFTVVGTTRSPLYLSYEKGNSAIGSGRIDNFIMLLDEDFNLDYYTEIGLTINGAKALNAYADQYFDVSDPIKDALEPLGIERSQIRLDDIKDEANEKYEEGVAEYEENKKVFDDEIANAKLQLQNGREKLAQGRQELIKQKNDVYNTMQNADKQLREGEQSLQLGRVEYEEGRQQFEAAKPEMEAQIITLKDAIVNLEQQIQQLKDKEALITQGLLDPTLTEDEIAQLKVQLQAIQEGIQTANAKLEELKSTVLLIEQNLTSTQTMLDQSKVTLDEAEAELKSKRLELEAGQNEANNKFLEAEKLLDTSELELVDGENQLEASKIDGEQKLSEAFTQLEDAKSEIDAIELPVWYVLDRHSQYSYMDYGSVAERMDGIAKVFPVFFFLVAALVCLTTMTRMVDEQRSTIGTLKALGYGKGAIAFKYVAYALIASTAGSIVGCVIGMYLFPLVIFNAWALMYVLPELHYAAQPVLAISSSVIVISITILAAISAVYKELQDVPATLMRPKPPKDGKKIMLERITFLWKRFSFIQKVTARNIFRYKKRFFMTVIGISGCTALLVAGFGIQDSISDVVEKQYGEIYLYDASFMYDDIDEFDKENVITQLQQRSEITQFMEVAQYNGITDYDNEEIAVSILVPSEVDEYQEFVNLRTRVGHEQLNLSDDSVIITEKLASSIGVSEGDVMKIRQDEGIDLEVLIGGVVENYIGHSMYMSADYYRQVFQSDSISNTVMLQLNDITSEDETLLGQELMMDEGIKSITFYSAAAQSFQDTISSLSFVVIVLIIAAGMLAFVVLYNLTNVNISERIREIATIKVLGFYDKEVSAYVYRENIALTIIGAIAGLLLGIALHQMIMTLAELDNVMFGRNINMLSFILSFLITMLFSIIVNLVMYRKLKNVPMVESLKSVE